MACSLAQILSVFWQNISPRVSARFKMASRGQPYRVHENPLNVLLLGHSFIAGFKKFLQDRDSIEHNVTMNLSRREFLIQFSGRRGAPIPRIRSDLEIVADFTPDICILQAGTNDICAKPKKQRIPIGRNGLPDSYLHWRSIWLNLIM